MTGAVATSAAPPDEADRRRIATDLRSTLFVEAGAGSGKTTALVERVVALVASGEATLDRLAAITFTEKAGAELRDRLRRRLEAEAGVDDPMVASRCRAAGDALDGAAIGTLHAFAQRLLVEHPVEAGLPPRVEVLDEVASELAFERRWTVFRDALFDDDDLARSVLLLVAAGVRPEALRVLALEFDRSWDLVAERVPDTADEPPEVTALVGEALELVEGVCARAGGCADPDDKLAVRLADIEAFAARLRAIDDEIELLDVLGGQTPVKPPSFRVGNVGTKKAWAGEDLAELRADVRAAGEALDAVAATVAQACARRLGAAIRRFTVDAAEQRRRSGQLGFHDLLVLARALLRHPDHGPAVRARLHDRYTHLLLDEFQDTDPIQVELAVRIAAAQPDGDDAGDAPWAEVDVAPGRLFFVGDPKQSIYRFRRADIATYLAAAERFGADGGTVALSTSFRTVAPVVDWVNHTFAALFGEAEHQPLPVPSQAPYTPLAPVRPAPPVGPSVSVVGRAPTDGLSAADLRRAEADQVAATVATAVAEGWSVATGDPDDPWRPARLGDVAILVPARTSLPFLEEALDRRGIPYRAESSSLVYTTRAVRDLLGVVRAVDDPTDGLAVVTALRSALLGCGDDDLVRYRVERHGRWSYLAEPPESVPPDDPVRCGLDALRAWHRLRWSASPSELLATIATDTRAFELGFAEGRPRDVWRRLRYVIDQARAWSDATGGGLRDYLHWVRRQTAEGARVAEAVLPETDDDAVRIMTIHAAKGLEFPITIVSGTSTRPQARRAAAEVAFPPAGGVGYRFGAAVVTEEFADWVPVDEQMGLHERIRLLYVACTRASDHLVVSLHRNERSKAAEPDKRTNAELLVEGTGDRLDDLPDAVADDRPVAAPPAAPPPPAPPPFHEWDATRRAALARAARRTTVAATALTDEGRPDDDDDRVVHDGGHDDPVGGAAGAGRPGDGPPPPGAPATAPTVDGSPEQLGLFDPPLATPITDGIPDLATPAAAPAPAAGGATGTSPGDGLGNTPDDDLDDPTAGVRKRPRDLDLPPWLKGRYGTAVGRAVHGVLQTVDLATGEGLDAAVAAQCDAEAIPDRRDTVERLARSALASPVVRHAATRPHWREVYACTPVGDRLLEGYADLLVRDDGGLVVVDHKTAATTDPDELDRRVAGYRLQGAAYALVLSRTTGEPVQRVVFCFLTPGGAVERELPDLAAAVADVERLVLAGHELEAPDRTDT